MDKIDYNKWASMSSLKIEELMALWFKLNPDESIDKQLNELLDDSNKKNKLLLLYYLLSNYEESINAIIDLCKKGIVSTITKPFNDSNEEWRKVRISKNEIKDFLIRIQNQKILERLNFLFNYEQKELLEAINNTVNNTLSPKKKSDLALLKQVETLGGALDVVTEDTDWTGTKIWNKIEKNPGKYHKIINDDPKRSIDLINKFLNIQRKK